MKDTGLEPVPFCCASRECEPRLNRGSLSKNGGYPPLSSADYAPERPCAIQFDCLVLEQESMWASFAALQYLDHIYIALKCNVKITDGSRSWDEIPSPWEERRGVSKIER